MHALNSATAARLSAANIYTRLDITASSSKRWMNCTEYPWLAETAALPRTSSIHADEGSEATDIAKAIMERRVDAHSVFNGEKPAMARHFKPDWGAHIKTYIDACHEYSQFAGRFPFEVVDEFAPLFYMPERRTAPDFAAFGDEGVAIVDLKFGAGVEVQAQDNYQLVAGGLSWALKLRLSYPDDHPVVLVIVQPRFERGAPIKEWRMTWGELLGHGEKMRETARRVTAQENLVLMPRADVCQFCPIGDSGQCPAKNAMVVRSGRHLAAMNAVSDEEKVELVKNEKLIEKTLAAWKGQLFQRAWAGDPIPGTFLGTSKGGSRQWSPTAEAAIVAKAEELGIVASTLFEPATLMSPAQIAKALPGSPTKKATADFIDSLVDERTPKPKLSFDGSKDKPFERDSDTLASAECDDDE